MECQRLPKTTRHCVKPKRRRASPGFSAVSVLPIEDDFLRFYRLDP